MSHSPSSLTPVPNMMSQNWRDSLVLKVTVAVVLKAIVFPLGGRLGKRGIVNLLGRVGLGGSKVSQGSISMLSYSKCNVLDSLQFCLICDLVMRHSSCLKDSSPWLWSPQSSPSTRAEGLEQLTGL